MLRRLLFTMLPLLAVSIGSHAKILRVGYNGIARAGVDYTDIGAAHAAAAAGDTLQLYGTVAIGSGTITKKLVITGFGYNFDVNPNLQAIGTDAPTIINGLLTFDPGSENSVLEGCSSNGNTLYISTSNITIRRCSGIGSSWILRNDLRVINNTRVESCVFYVLSMQSATANACTNIQLYNSIFYSVNFYLSGTSGSVINCTTSSPNYVSGTLNLNNAGFLVKNCIISPYNAANTNTVWENNFFGAAIPSVLPQGSNNRWGQSWTNLFTRLGGTSDVPSYVQATEFDEDYFVLKTGSPAINGGFDASNNPTDCGIYGGDAAFRYKLSGVPAVPAIYKLTAPSSAATTNPYNVTISVRSNN